MPKYKIFTGLGGGFGGATEHIIEEFENLEDAEEYAWEEACEEYESYGGMHGLFNREEALEEYSDLTEEDLDAMYDEDRENWIEYWAELVEDD